MNVKFIQVLPLTLGLLLAPAFQALADNNDGLQNEAFACANSVNVMDCIEKTRASAVTPTGVSAIPMNSLQLGMTGPIGLDVRYDNQLGWIPEISYLQMFYDNGINLELAYGANEQRINVTLGHVFSPEQQIKFTYEYLAQNLPFDFTTGSVNEWVNQNAFGLAYRYLFFNQLLRSIYLNGYYIRANSDDLSDIVFYQNGDAYLNLRRIAGGTEETVTPGITVAPFQQLLITLGGGYSHLVYDTEYESNNDTTTIAYNAGLDLLITPRTKFGASIANSAAETDSNVRISQIFPAKIEAAVTAQYSQGQAGQPNSSSITLGLAYPATTYAMAAEDTLGTLKAWIQKPVIHAPRVLAIRDEAVLKYGINATDPPAQALMTGQMIQSISTQDIFNFEPSMYDNVVYSLSMASSNPGMGSPQSQLYITVTPDNNSPYQATIYSTAPLPNSATPSAQEPSVYNIIITAVGYKNGLTTPMQSQAVLELDVNFNKDNEPTWATTAGSIAFDATSTANGINLNAMITQPNGASQPVKFYFTDPNQYPNWNIVETSGTWFLVRKSVNGYLDASDISTTPQKLMIAAQYADDPAGLSVAAQAVNVTVKPDSKISFAWQPTGCQVNPQAIQPTNTSTVLLGLVNCTLYKDANMNIINVVGDTSSYKIKNSDYPTSLLKILDDQVTLQVTGPTNNLGNTYSVNFNVTSTAQGGTTELSGTNSIQVGNTLTVNSVDDATNATNTYYFENAATHLPFVSVVIKGLDNSKSYKITNIVSSQTLDTAKVARGSVTTDAQYEDPSVKVYAWNTLISPSGGAISMIQYGTNGAYPAVSSLTIQLQ